MSAPKLMLFFQTINEAPQSKFFRDQSIYVLLWGDPDQWNFLLICEHFEYELNSICTSNPARSCSYVPLQIQIGFYFSIGDGQSTEITFIHFLWVVFFNSEIGKGPSPHSSICTLYISVAIVITASGACITTASHCITAYLNHSIVVLATNQLL